MFLHGHLLGKPRSLCPGLSLSLCVGLSEPEIDHFVMAITAAEASPSDGLSCRMFAAERLDGRTQMRKTTLFAAAAALIATGFGV